MDILVIVPQMYISYMYQFVLRLVLFNNFLKSCVNIYHFKGTSVAYIFLFFYYQRELLIPCLFIDGDLVHEILLKYKKGQHVKLYDLQ